MSSDNTRFRITPVGRLDEPLVYGATAEPDGDRAIRIRPTASPIELPVDVTVQELPHLDLTSAQDVADFVARTGVPAFHHATSVGYETMLPITELDRIRRAALHVVQGPDARAWEGAEPFNDRFTDGALSSDDTARPGDLETVQVLSYYLQRLAPRVVVGLQPESGHRDFRPVVPSSTAMCVQLANILADSVPLKRCANETCGQVFSRQVGRSEHGQHRRTGVKFCTVNCSRAQAQRDFRRRKRN